MKNVDEKILIETYYISGDNWPLLADHSATSRSTKKLNKGPVEVNTSHSTPNKEVSRLRNMPHIFHAPEFCVSHTPMSVMIGFKKGN